MKKIRRLLRHYLDDDEPVRVGVGELLQFRGDHFAGSTPGGMEIDQHEKVPGGFQLGIEVSLRMRREKDEKKKGRERSR